jgi:hypothetical protein
LEIRNRRRQRIENGEDKWKGEDRGWGRLMEGSG